MPALRSTLFKAYFFLFTVCMSVLGLWTLLWQPLTLCWMRLWAYGTLAGLRGIVGINWKIQGIEHVPAGHGIIACKHQSVWETVIMFSVFHHPIYLAKRELTWIPLFGWYMLRGGNIGIHRAAGASAMKHMIAAVKKQLSGKGSRHVIIFPEGTRTQVGQAPALKPGIVALYHHAGVPVVPASVNSGECWSKYAPHLTAGTITLCFKPALPEGLSKTALLERLHRDIQPL